MKKKYLFVDADDIRRIKFDTKREFSYNDYDIVYLEQGYEKVLDCFSKYDIPMNYQKIILELNYKFLNKDKGRDFFTNKEYYLYNKKDIINGNSVDIQTPLFVCFSSKKNFREQDMVITFYNDLVRNNYLDDYILALKDMYRSNYYNAFYKIMNENKYDDKINNLKRIKK